MAAISKTFLRTNQLLFLDCAKQGNVEFDANFVMTLAWKRPTMATLLFPGLWHYGERERERERAAMAEVQTSTVFKLRQCSNLGTMGNPLYRLNCSIMTCGGPSSCRLLHSLRNTAASPLILPRVSWMSWRFLSWSLRSHVDPWLQHLDIYSVDLRIITLVSLVIILYKCSQ